MLLQPTPVLREAAVKATALLYALAVAEDSSRSNLQQEPRKLGKLMALSELITEDCDAEQIWAQIQLAQVRRLIQSSSRFRNILVIYFLK